LLGSSIRVSDFADNELTRMHQAKGFLQDIFGDDSVYEDKVLGVRG